MKVILLVSAAVALAAGAIRAEPVRRLSLSDYRDRMTAGWLGQMIGVEWGAPTEAKFNGKIIPEDKVPVWSADWINRALENDDLFVEATFLGTLERCGINASPREAGIDFANTTYWLCQANWIGRNNLRRGYAPPACAHPSINNAADTIDFQIESDFAGLVSPGLPTRALALCETFGSVVNYGDGLLGGKFMSGLYAEAFFTADIDRILDAGLACIPAESQYAGMVRDVRQWHRENPDDWTVAWKKATDRYYHDREHYQRNGGVQPDLEGKLNGAYVVIGLLYGRGDIKRTMLLSMRCGCDSDCNPSSAGGVLATALGTAAISRQFDFNLDRSRTFLGQTMTFAHALEICEMMARQAVVAAGGKITRDAAGAEWMEIPVLRPSPGTYDRSWAPPPIGGERFTPDEMTRIRERPYTNFVGYVRDVLRDSGTNRTVRFSFAPYFLDQESPNGPVRIVGLEDAELHLGFAWYVSRSYRPLFAFERCRNVKFHGGRAVYRENVPLDDPVVVLTNDCVGCSFDLEVDAANGAVMLPRAHPLEHRPMSVGYQLDVSRSKVPTMERSSR